MNDSDTRNAINYLTTLAQQEFWGFVRLKFEKGRVVHVRREENLKPRDLTGSVQQQQLPERNRGSRLWKQSMKTIQSRSSGLRKRTLPLVRRPDRRDSTSLAFAHQRNSVSEWRRWASKTTLVEGLIPQQAVVLVVGD